MRNKFFYALIFLFILSMVPASILAKEKDDRKDRGHHNKYFEKDEKTKEIRFQKDVKEKVDKIVKGAVKSMKAPERSKKEKNPIPEAYLDQYDEETEYNYDYSKEFKGDEDDEDFELINIKSSKIKKLIEQNDKKRDKGWGWYWDKSNKGKRDKKHGKWSIHPILKKIAWKHYRMALKYHEQEKYEQAKKHLLRALWFWPTFVEAHTQLGIENLALNLPDKAEINCKRAVKIDPYYCKAYYILSLIYLIKDPVELFNSVEACEYAKQLKCDVDANYYEFLMLISKLPPPTDSETPQEDPVDDDPAETDPVDDGKPGRGHSNKGKKDKD